VSFDDFHLETQTGVHFCWRASPPSPPGAFPVGQACLPVSGRPGSFSSWVGAAAGKKFALSPGPGKQASGRWGGPDRKAVGRKLGLAPGFVCWPGAFRPPALFRGGDRGRNLRRLVLLEIFRGRAVPAFAGKLRLAAPKKAWGTGGKQTKCIDFRDYFGPWPDLHLILPGPRRQFILFASGAFLSVGFAHIS